MRDGIRAGATGAVRGVIVEEPGGDHKRLVSLVRAVAPTGTKWLGQGGAGRAASLS